MTKRFAPMVILFFFAGLSCLYAQDPVKVSPEHYKVLLDNDQVRVLRATRGPREKAPMHSHPEYVAVYLTDLDQKNTAPDGSTQEVHRKAGAVSHSDPLSHAEENISDKPLEVIVIELKDKPAGASTYQYDPATDPVKLEPQYHKVEFENDRVRILRTRLEPHVPAPMHTHPNYVTVYLTDVHTKMTMADGTVNDNRRKKSEVGYRAGLKHKTENVEDQPADEIQVELK
jgi:quercetin dioxygenase-like cupin family protein